MAATGQREASQWPPPGSEKRAAPTREFDVTANGLSFWLRERLSTGSILGVSEDAEAIGRNIDHPLFAQRNSVTDGAH